MRYKAVAFDLDGTLYPEKALFRRAWPIVLSKAKRFMAFNAVRREIRVLQASAEYRRSPPVDGAAFRERQAELVARRLGQDPAGLADFFAQCFYGEVDELFSKVKPFPGLREALAAISGSGLRLALLSDFPPARKLELMGLKGAFEIALCSEDSGFLKPAPEPFAMLATRLNLETRDILYVGNSIAYDLGGARAVGMDIAIIKKHAVPAADLAFRDWSDLVNFALA